MDSIPTHPSGTPVALVTTSHRYLIYLRVCRRLMRQQWECANWQLICVRLQYFPPLGMNVSHGLFIIASDAHGIDTSGPVTNAAKDGRRFCYRTSQSDSRTRVLVIDVQHCEIRFICTH